ncbi:MAG: peptidyl-prolyl cis-trans isomerase [Terracidiphilus sp.]
MKFTFPNPLFLILSFAAAGAQVASHAPTVFAPAPSSAPAVVSLVATGKPVAHVNGSVLTDTDLVREEYAIFPYARQHNGIPPELAPQVRAGALKMIVFEELVYQEALRRKMTILPAKAQKAEADFRKQFDTPEEFNAIFQGEFHGSEPLLREKIRRSLLIDAFLKSEVQIKGAVTPAEVREYYVKNPARYEHPETYTCQTISVIPPDKATADQLKEGRKRADAALRQAKATKTSEQFGLLAEKISDDDYRVMMGQHKPIPVSELAPQVVKALSTLKPGGVTDLIQVGQIYTVIRLGEHTPAGETKFADVKAQLATELQQTKTNQIRAALDKRLRQNARIEEP